jgi:amino acid transporter
MTAEATVSPPPREAIRPADVGLRREMGLIGATWASETSIIGSGWLFGAFYAYTAAGGEALLGWVIGGVAIIILALVHAELGGMYPVSGGTARFPHFAFGTGAGITFGFFSWLQAVTVAPVECYAVFQYLSYYHHGFYNSSTSLVTTSGFIMTIVLMAVFTAVNFLAMRWFNRVNSLLTWWKVAIPILAIIILFTKFHSGNFSAGATTASGSFFGAGAKALFFAIPSSGIVFAYLGFEQADQLAGEIKNPQKNLPRAIILAIALGTLIYILLQVVFVGALPGSSLVHGWVGLGKNSLVSGGPFAAVAGLVALGWLATILRIDAVVSPSGTGLMYETSTSRIGYGLARNRYYPQVFSWVDARGIPWVSLICAFAFGLIFLLPFPSWHSLVSLVTGASVLMYAGAPLAMGALRRQVPDAYRPYRMPGAAVLGPIAFVVANMLIYWSGFLVVWKLGIAIVIGYVIIGVFMIFDSQRPPINWRASIWLPAYLIGMGIISWQGQYSGLSGNVAGKPPTNTNNIPFWWDMLVVVGFSLIIYLWAYLSRLPRQETLDLVARQAGPADTGHAQPPPAGAAPEYA